LADTADRIVLRASASGAPVVLGGVVAVGASAFVRVEFGPVSSRERSLSAPLPPGADRRLLSLSVRLTPEGAKSSTHQGAEGGQATSLPGTLRISDSRFSGWLAGETPQAGPTVVISYTLTGGGSVLLRAPQPTDGRRIPCVVSPDVARVAGPHGVVQLEMPGGVSLTGRVVAIASAFPTLDEPFAVADASVLTTAVAYAQPFVAAPHEVWIGGTGGEEARVGAALRSAPYDRLVVSSRSAREADLRADPLARGITITLWTAAVVALVLAVGGLVLASTGTLRDERDELYDLETQGVPPSTLRNQLRIRAAALGTVGALGGIALGAVLALSTIGLVALTAGVSSPRPALVLDVGWEAVLLTAAAVAIAAALAVVATTALAFREAVPRRAGGAAP
jgi:hypothetical protein